MQNNFEACLQFTLQEEGGYSSNPSDPGGDTMKGITLSIYREWNRNPTLTATNLKNISEAEVADIYQTMYWNAVQGNSLNAGVDLMVFDMQVNAGDNSARILQATIGVTVDGIIGPITLAAANAISPELLVNELSTNQENFYRSLAEYPIFGVGWTNRVNARTSTATTMVKTVKAAKVTGIHDVSFIKSIR